MAEHIITGANDVELVLEQGGVKVGTPATMRRLVVDDFSITHDEDNTTESGIGHRGPAGFVFGDAEYTWSFTMLGDDLEVFDMVATENGLFTTFSFTARKTDENGVIEWEFALDPVLPTSEEPSASSGDALEYSVEGEALNLDRRTG